ncbi:MAG: prepilin-type N-terminal cleavage/methylation domain-containing protein [Legionellaceae bacterium]|nr:prepilin-type N-terminal cleavage/methylation domain-containing protein [Legionellaceae bacterium]
MNNNKNIQRGFTFIEIVMLIVVLGILAAVAMPHFIYLQRNKQQAVIDGVANTLTVASSINHAGCSAVDNVVTAGKCVRISKCSDIASIISPIVILGVSGAAQVDVYNLADDISTSSNNLDVVCKLQIIKNGTTYTQNYTITGAGN